MVIHLSKARVWNALKKFEADEKKKRENDKTIDTFFKRRSTLRQKKEKEIGKIYVCKEWQIVFKEISSQYLMKKTLTSLYFQIILNIPLFKDSFAHILTTRKRGNSSQQTAHDQISERPESGRGRILPLLSKSVLQLQQTHHSHVPQENRQETPFGAETPTKHGRHLRLLRRNQSQRHIKTAERPIVQHRRDLAAFCVEAKLQAG